MRLIGFVSCMCAIEKDKLALVTPARKHSSAVPEMSTFLSDYPRFAIAGSKEWMCHRQAQMHPLNFGS